LLRIFGGDKIKNLMQAFNLPEDTPIGSGMVSKAVNQAQSRVEGSNFDIRRHLLDFDDVLNRQRTVIYAKRLKILEAGEKNEVRPILEETLRNYVDFMVARLEEQPSENQDEKHEGKIKELRDKLAALPERLEPERALIIGQHLVRVLDSLWVDHLENLEALRESVNIRAYGQHEPIVEYRREASGLFQQLNANFESLVFNTVFQILELDLKRIMESRKPKPQPPPAAKNIGRNDPCWCGSGKKYKRCHGV
ncbi:MAG: SEC-C metal-binding domain-containing protein, partial [Patescibacteria group bacterium]